MSDLAPDSEGSSEDRGGRPGRSRKRVPRHVAVNRLMSLYENPRYLEVGVCSGRTFDRARATSKVAVDPVFEFDHQDPARVQDGVEYHQVTSDEYFGTIIEPDRRFDVIFLDGLHTLEQTLRDLTNALHHLQPRGVIVVDDVRPPSYLASLPGRQRYFEVRRRLGVTDTDWMGDVYRLVYLVDTFFQQLTYRTIENNHGQAVLWRKRRPSVTARTVGEVAQWSFEDLVLQQEVLQLKPFREIFDELREDLQL